MTIRPRLDAETVSHNMREIEPRYSEQEAFVEASRCLYCYDAPCIHSCPTGIDIPAFIKKIAVGQPTGAARTILRANVLGASCARVCPTEVLCEGACVMLDRDDSPIKIGRLQRFATDHVYDHGISVLARPEQRSGKRIAVIGAGPAGLSCAAELAQLGHDVVIFEKRERAGGLNTYGIAYYKLRPETSLEEVALVRGLGVDIREGVEVGKDVSAEDIRRDHDAVFLGVGLGRTFALGVPGEDLPGVVEALDFIADLRTRPLAEVAVGERVMVIGCGNTAIDAVTQAKRLGAAEATILYRRGESDMPAYEYEYEIGKADGAGFRFHVQPVAILGNGSVEGIRLARTRIVDGRLERVADSEFDVPCDMVIKALGQQTLAGSLAAMFPGLDLDARGAIQREFATGRTSVEGVWAGGDAANGGSEVVDAVAEGKRAARDMHLALVRKPAPVVAQTTRGGLGGPPVEAGLDGPVRVQDLEEAYRRDNPPSPARGNSDG